MAIPARASNKPIKSPNRDAKVQLLRAAKKLFARKGLSGTSIRDISREAKVNSSLISYYFNGKENLYRQCLIEIGQTRLSAAQDILKAPENLTEFRLRTRLFIEHMLGLYLEDRDAGLILMREYDRLKSPAEDVFKQGFLQIYELIVDFFKKAQERKLIDEHFDAFLLASLLFGSLTSQMRLDHLKEKTYGRSIKEPEEKQKLIDHLVNLFLLTPERATNL